jgi:hypothetical protein
MVDFLSGKEGKVSVGGVDINVTNWSFDPAADMHETTHSGGSGYKTYVPGTKGATGSFEGVWDVDNRPSDTPNLVAGAKLTNLRLYEQAAGGYISIPIAYVNGAPIASEVNGLITFTVNFTVSGSWTMPT